MCAGAIPSRLTKSRSCLVCETVLCLCGMLWPAASQALRLQLLANQSRAQVTKMKLVLVAAAVGIVTSSKLRQEAFCVATGLSGRRFGAKGARAACGERAINLFPPFFFHNNSLFCFAGLWSRKAWRVPMHPGSNETVLRGIGEDQEKLLSAASDGHAIEHVVISVFSWFHKQFSTGRYLLH